MSSFMETLAQQLSTGEDTGGSPQLHRPPHHTWSPGPPPSLGPHPSPCSSPDWPLPNPPPADTILLATTGASCTAWPREGSRSLFHVWSPFSEDPGLHSSKYVRQKPAAKELVLSLVILGVRHGSTGHASPPLPPCPPSTHFHPCCRHTGRRKGQGCLCSCPTTTHPPLTNCPVEFSYL